MEDISNIFPVDTEENDQRQTDSEEPVHENGEFSLPDNDSQGEEKVAPENENPAEIGKSFADIAATVTELLGVPYETPGKSFAKEIL